MSLTVTQLEKKHTVPRQAAALQKMPPGELLRRSSCVHSSGWLASVTTHHPRSAPCSAPNHTQWLSAGPADPGLGVVGTTWRPFGARSKLGGQYMQSTSSPAPSYVYVVE